jgi:hypothetical protein
VRDTGELCAARIELAAAGVRILVLAVQQGAPR